MSVATSENGKQAAELQVEQLTERLASTVEEYRIEKKHLLTMHGEDKQRFVQEVEEEKTKSIKLQKRIESLLSNGKCRV